MRRRRAVPKKAIVEEVKKSAAPVLAKLDEVRKEHQRIDAQIEREIRLIRGV